MAGCSWAGTSVDARLKAGLTPNLDQIAQGRI